jgi:hypothetical protein
MTNNVNSDMGNNVGVDSVEDAIKAGYSLKSAKAQQKQMINGIERMMHLSSHKRQSNPIDPNKADILPWYLYDQINVPVGTTTGTEIDFFTVPQGGTQFTTVKTKQQTNLTQVRQLSAPLHFNTTSLQIYFASNMLKADIDSALNNFWLEFWIGDKIYAEAPLFKYPSGAGLSGYSVISGQAAWSNGIANPCAVVDFRMGDNPIGHHILQGQNFSVKILGTAFTPAASPGTGLNFYCILEGILSRGVQ